MSEDSSIILPHAMLLGCKAVGDPSRMYLTEDDRDHADLLFVRMRSGDQAQERSARRELQAWCNTDQARREYVARLAVADQVLDALDPLPEPAATPIASLEARRARLSPARRALPWLAAASVAAIATGLWIIDPVISSAQYSAKVGEQKEVLLADGSHVVLNTGTHLQYSARLHSREIRLLEGEATFDVEHHLLRPFRVFSEQTQVKVVGTFFSVRNLGDGSRIKVARGLVEVRALDTPQPRLLSAGQQVDTSSGHFDSEVRPVDINSISDWRDGRLVFDAVPLREVLQEIQRYRERPIQLLDPKLGELKFTGSFSIKQPDQVLGLLPNIYPVRVAIAADGTARISRR